MVMPSALEKGDVVTIDGLKFWVVEDPSIEIGNLPPLDSGVLLKEKGNAQNKLEVRDRVMDIRWRRANRPMDNP